MVKYSAYNSGAYGRSNRRPAAYSDRYNHDAHSRITTRYSRNIEDLQLLVKNSLQKMKDASDTVSAVPRPEILQYTHLTDHELQRLISAGYITRHSHYAMGVKMFDRGRLIRELEKFASCYIPERHYRSKEEIEADKKRKTDQEREDMRKWLERKEQEEEARKRRAEEEARAAEALRAELKAVQASQTTFNASEPNSEDIERADGVDGLHTCNVTAPQLFDDGSRDMSEAQRLHEQGAAMYDDLMTILQDARPDDIKLAELLKVPEPEPVISPMWEGLHEPVKRRRRKSKSKKPKDESEVF